MDRASRWLADRENFLFAALVVIHLIPLWAFPYTPSQDGPAHIHNAKVILEYDHPDRTVFRDYYVLNKEPVPNWFGHLLLAALMVLMPVLMAEKLFLTLYVIGLPVSVRYTLRAIRPESGFLAFLSFPFIYNYLFHMGNYSFCLGLPMFFLFFGYWFKHQEQFVWKKTAVLALLSLLLYFCHIVALGMGYVAVALLTIWLTIIQLTRQARQRRFDGRAVWRAFQARTVRPLCAVVPTLILIAVFLIPRHSKVMTPEDNWWLVNGLFSMYSIVSHNADLRWLAGAFMLVFVAISFRLLIAKTVHRDLNQWDGLLLVAAAFVVIYFAAPETHLVSPNGMSGGGYIARRLNLFPYLAMILWFAAQSYGEIVKRGVRIAASSIACVFLAFHTMSYSEINEYLEEYLSGMNLVEPNTTLLPLTFSPNGLGGDGRPLSDKVGVFLHASGHIAAQRHIVHLDNYEADMGYFPTLFRDELNPYRHISIDDMLEGTPPRVDFLTYPARTGGEVDYVLVWQVREEQRELEDTRSIFEQLDKGYEAIFSSPRGFMQLYRRKTFAGPVGNFQKSMRTREAGPAS